MRIVFLNPPFDQEKKIIMKEIGRCGSTALGNQFWPQMGLAYLASISRKKHKTIIIDAISEKMSFEATLNRLKEFKPSLIIVHVSTPTYYNDVSFINLIKEKLPNLEIGVVGSHVSNAVKHVLKQKNIDFVIVNEPELTFQELLVNKNWSQILGLAYKKKNKIYVNKSRELGELDNLPFPARDLLPQNKYRMVLTDNEVFTTLVASRGCPYKCIYCRVGKPWGKIYRTRSVENVIEEIKEIRYTHNIKNIVFMSDTFTLNRTWILSFCNEIIKQGINIRWLCNSRVDLIDKEMLTLMKKAGCFLISYGIESGSQKMLDIMKKGITLKQSRNAVKLTKQLNIKVFAYFILGIPGETKATIDETIKFSLELDPDYVNFHIATPHPGTKLYDLAKKFKLIKDFDYSHYDQSGSYFVMNLPGLSSEYIKKVQKKAMIKFFFRPKRILQKFLENINKPLKIVELSKIAFNLLKS